MIGCGPGSIRHTTPSRRAVTQTLPAPTAIEDVSSVASRIRCATRFVRGSILVTTGPLTTQTACASAATSSVSTSIVATSFPVLGSSRESVWSGLCVQTAPAPTAMSLWPSLNVAIAALPVLSGSLTV